MANWIIMDSNQEYGIGVEHYPDRKKGCLTSIHNNEHTVLATFTNEYTEEMFTNIIGQLFGSMIVKK